MSDSAQELNQMFLDLDLLTVNTLDEFPSYCAPITAQEGATILANTEMLQENSLPCPRIS